MSSSLTIPTRMIHCVMVACLTLTQEVQVQILMDHQLIMPCWRNGKRDRLRPGNLAVRIPHRVLLRKWVPKLREQSRLIQTEEILKVRSLPSVLYAHSGTGIHRRLKTCVFWVRIPVGIPMACSSTVRVTLL